MCVHIPLGISILALAAPPPFVFPCLLKFALLQVDKTCNSSIPSSCENSFRMDCPTSLPLVGAVVVFIYWLESLHRNAVCHTTVPPVCGAHCLLSCRCAAGLLWPGRRGQTKAAGDDGEQQLRLSDARLRQNNGCVRVCVCTCVSFCVSLGISFFLFLFRRPRVPVYFNVIYTPVSCRAT